MVLGICPARVLMGLWGFAEGPSPPAATQRVPGPSVGEGSLLGSVREMGTVVTLVTLARCQTTVECADMWNRKGIRGQASWVECGSHRRDITKGAVPWTVPASML